MEWAAAQVPDTLFISVITLMEIEIGILRLERRDPTQAARLRPWAERIVPAAFARRILAVDAAVARRAAPMHVPDPSAERDALIAATALVHGLIVVTRNVGDFARTGARVTNPWL